MQHISKILIDGNYDFIVQIILYFNKRKNF